MRIPQCMHSLNSQDKLSYVYARHVLSGEEEIEGDCEQYTVMNTYLANNFMKCWIKYKGEKNHKMQTFVSTASWSHLTKNLKFL